MDGSDFSLNCDKNGMYDVVSDPSGLELEFVALQVGRLLFDWGLILGWLWC